MRSGFKTFSKLLALVLIVSAITFLAGIYTSENDLPPAVFLRDVNQNGLASLDQFRQSRTGEQTSRTLSSINFGLDETKMEVPVSRSGAGGGLTSVGDELVLLTHEGTIFTYYDEELKKTLLKVPDNGYSDYVKAAESEKFRHLKHNTYSFRYNDILFIESNSVSRLAISYTQWYAENECYGNTVAILDFDEKIDSIQNLEASPDDWKILYESQPCLVLKDVSNALEGYMSGGRISQQDAQHIVLANGDYYWDGVYTADKLSQSDKNDYGKIVQINIGTATSRHIAKGVRNPQGIHIDVNRNIWVTEHGPRGGDELNLIKEGANYGWPLETYGTRYSRSPWPMARQPGRHTTYEKPVFSWVPSIAVSNIITIDNFEPSWDGDLLVASLNDQQLYRLRMDDERVVFAEPITIKERIRYVHQHSDNRIVLWTDSKKLLFLKPSTQTYTNELIGKFIDESDRTSKQKSVLHSIVDSCSECHSFEPNNHRHAPGLGDIFGRNIASTSYKNYTSALASIQKKWTKENLTAFLLDPQSFAPGTNMPATGMNDDWSLPALVSIIEQLKSDNAE